MSFANYKKTRTTELESIKKRLDDIANKPKFGADDRFWKPTLDKAGNGSAIIRFCPPPEGEDFPWVYYWDHNFDVDGTYFVDKCLDTKRPGTCPVCKWLKPYWKLAEGPDGDTDAKKLTGDRKKKKYYIANIVVIKDKENPENEGRVFLFRFGTKIYEKIMAKVTPKDEDDAPLYIYDFYDGADFKIDVKKVKGFNNYDDSEFKTPSKLFAGDDAKLEKVWNAMHKLSPFVDDSLFKTVEELNAKFLDITSGTGAKPNVAKKADDLFAKASDKPVERKAAKKTAASKKVEEPEPEVELDSDDLNMYDELVEDMDLP